MEYPIEERVRQIAIYVCRKRATVREAAQQFCISKSTVHKDLTERLKRLDEKLYEQVRLILEQHRAERHLRGGEATRRKFALEKRIRNARTSTDDFDSSPFISRMPTDPPKSGIFIIP